MLRLRLDLAYDGGGFSGWAAQPGRRTVEGELAAALTTLLRVPEAVRLTVAGRTDAGVHARGQVAHADVPEEAYAAVPGTSRRSPQEALGRRLNAVLPPDIVVHRVQPAAEGFDARFSALARHYRYRICDDPSLLDPLRRHDTVTFPRALDVEAMTRAGGSLVGRHDFASFCKKRDGATTIRTLLRFSWSRPEPGIVEGRVTADAFCHSMVRALVGSVVPVGDGRADELFPVTVLRSAIRDPRVKVMPAHGLSLEQVDYPPDDQLARRAREARAVRSAG